MKAYLGKAALAALLALLLALTLAALAEGDVAINSTNFPDANFRNYILENIDDGDGVLSEGEIYWTRYLDVADHNISSLKGIEFFTELETLHAPNNPIKTLDLSKNTKLRDAVLYDCQLTSLNVSGCAALDKLECGNNQLTKLSVANNTLLTSFSCDHNQLTSLDLTKNTELGYFTCDVNRLTSLKLPNSATLGHLDCSNNQLTTLNVANNPGLTHLNCSNNQLAQLNVSSNPNLDHLDCGANLLTALNVTKNPDLHVIICSNNQLTALDVSKNDLWVLDCRSNQLTALDVTMHSALDRLDCSVNPLGELDVSNCVSLHELMCGDDELTELNLRSNRFLERVDCGGNPLTELDVSNALLLTRYINDENYHPQEWGIVYGIPGTFDDGEIWGAAEGLVVPYDVNIITDDFDYISIEDYFDDPNFRAYIHEAIDGDHDGFLSSEEIMDTREIWVGDRDIENLWGIQVFTEVEVLHCYHNRLDGVDTGNMHNLRELNCAENRITDLYLERNPQLETLLCYDNQLTGLYLHANPALTYVECFANKIEWLNVNGCPNLETLWCSSNELYDLDLTQNPELRFLFCYDNHMENLWIDNNTYLTEYVNPEHYQDWGYALIYGVTKDADEPWDRFVKGVFCDPYTQIWGGDPYEVVRVNSDFFPDDNFRAYIASEEVDWDQSGILSREELAREGIDVYGLGIESLQGIRYFTALRELFCSNNRLTSLELNDNRALEALWADQNQLEWIEMNECEELRLLCIWGNEPLHEIDTTNHPYLWYLNVDGTGLTELYLAENPNLEMLSCTWNELTYLDLTNNHALRMLNCEYNNIIDLDLTQCPELTQYVNAEYYVDDLWINKFGMQNEDNPDWIDCGVSCDNWVDIYGGDQWSAYNTMTLPAAAKIIDEEAFAGTATNVVFIDAADYIGSRAFADSLSLKRVYINSAPEISDDAFENSDNVTIFSVVPEVQQWAEDHGIRWVDKN